MREALLRLLRRPWMGRLVRWGVMHMTWAIPAERLIETEALVAFRHPRPSYAVHILIVPKRPYATLLDVRPDDQALWRDLYAAVQSLVQSEGLARGSYRLIVNGGGYQEVAHLHWHLVGEPAEMRCGADKT